MAGQSLLVFGAFLVALLISTFSTSVLIKYLLKRNLIKQSSDDRWHKNPTPVFGGVGIFIAFALTSLVFVPFNKSFLLLFGAGALMFFTGLIDDIKRMSPPTKLTAQIVAACAIVIGGFAMPLTANMYLNMAVSFFLIVCLTNSFNLLDNMDGLSSGVAIIVLIVRGCFFAYDGDMNGLIITSVLIGSIGGFLIFNYHPAKIFMGDCGSLFIGFSVASLFLIEPLKQVNVQFEKNILLLLLLAIPLFDTFFVSITRKINGRKISQGGKDHLSHRLVKAGLSERMAVGLLWAIAGFTGFISFFVYSTHEYSIAAVIGTLTLLFAILFGRYLAKPEKGMGAPVSSQSMTIVKMFYQFKYKRYLLQMIMDVFCIVVTYYVAYLLRFQNLTASGQLDNFMFSVFVITPVLLVSLSFSGVYRGTWKYVDIPDIMTICKGIVIGTVLSITVFMVVFRFDSFSRAVLINNALILMVVLPAIRASYRIFDEIIYKLQDKQKVVNILIYGAGRNGEYLVRMLKQQHINSVRIVGFIDDDPELSLNTIMGAKVLGTVNEIDEIIQKHRVDEIHVSTGKITTEKMRKVIQTVAKTNTKLYKEEHTLNKAEIPLVLAS